MPEPVLQQLEILRDSLGEPARDLKLNLSTVLASELLTADQTWGIALASACYLRHPVLRAAVLADAQANGISENVIEDAWAAASIMGMNTVYYRFRHMIQKPSYAQMQPKLRMQWMARPKTSKGDFELFSLAVAALAGCEMCIRSHEESILKHGLTEAHVHETVRITAVLSGFAVGLPS